MFRDTKVAEAIESIGAASPVAKKMVLSGEVNIEKKFLEELSSRPKEEIEEIAARIENGTFQKEKPAAQSPAGSDKHSGDNLAGILSLKTAISSLTDNLGPEMEKITEMADKSELKAAIRSCIDMLEAMYRAI